MLKLKVERVITPKYINLDLLTRYNFSKFKDDLYKK